MRKILFAMLVVAPLGAVAQTPSDLAALRGVVASSALGAAHAAEGDRFGAADLAAPMGIGVTDGHASAPAAMVAGALTAADLARAQGLVSTPAVVRTQDVRIALLRREK